MKRQKLSEISDNCKNQICSCSTRAIDFFFFAAESKAVRLKAGDQSGGIHSDRRQDRRR